jgi:cytochrome P450
VLEPFAGRRSILVLDGAEHLRQRKLMLPPLPRRAHAGFRPLVAELAREELARWPSGPVRSTSGCRR